MATSLLHGLQTFFFRTDAEGTIDSLPKLLDLYDITLTGNELDLLDLDFPTTIDDKIDLPETAPSGGAIIAFIGGPYLTALEASIADMDEVIYYCEKAESVGLSTKEIILKEEIDSATNVEMDEGDYYLFRATLKAAKAFALIISAYDLNVSIQELVALFNAGSIDWQSYMESHQDLLRLLPTGTSPVGSGAVNITAAKQLLLEAITDYLTA